MMKQLISIFIISLFALPINSMESKEKKEKTTEVVIFNVNMDCQNCVDNITRKISFETGVKDLYINLEKQVVAVKFRSDKTTKKHLKEVLIKMKYIVTETENSEYLPNNWKQTR